MEAKLDTMEKRLEEKMNRMIEKADDKNHSERRKLEENLELLIDENVKTLEDIFKDEY